MTATPVPTAVMAAHRRDGRRAPGPRPPTRTSAAVVALCLLAFATLVVVYRDAGALRGAASDTASKAASDAASGAASKAASGAASVSVRDAACLRGERVLAIDKTDFQNKFARSMMLVPPTNLWDNRKPSASELQLEERLRNATDARARARVMEEMVHASYCGFQVVHGNSSTLREDLASLRLDRPALVTGVRQPVPGWTAEHFISEYEASAVVSVIVMPEGDEALEYEKGLEGKARDKLSAYGFLKTQRMGLREYAERIAKGEARNLISTTNLIGDRFGTDTYPWMNPCDEACAPIDAGVEEAAWDAGIPQRYPSGPWSDATRRLREWVRHVQSAPSREVRNARVQAFDEYYERSRTVGCAKYARDAMVLSGREFRERWAEPEGSFSSSPVFFLGQHLGGLHAHSHQRAVTVAANGYRVWYVKWFGDATMTRSFVSAFEHFTQRANFELANPRGRTDAVCTQPPGSMVILPQRWQHSIIGWAEDEHGRPAPLDQPGGMTVSLSYQ